MTNPITYGGFFMSVYRRILVLGLAVVACFCVDTARGQAHREVSSSDKRIQIEANLVPADPAVSDEPVLTLTVRHPTEYSASTPQLGDRYGDFQVLDQARAPETVEKGVETSVATYRLRPGKSGQVALPPLAVTLTPVSNPDDSSRAETLVVPAGTVRVLSRYEDKEVSSNDLSGPSPPLASYARAGIALALILLLGLALVLFARYHRRRTAQATAVAPTPFEVAKGELDELMNKRLYERDVKEFYLRITGIVRWYIEKVTGVQAPDRTTEEFLREITSDLRHRETFSDELRVRLRHFLEFADLVKFAKFQPTLDDVFDGYRSANSVVEYRFESTCADSHSNGKDLSQ